MLVFNWGLDGAGLLAAGVRGVGGELALMLATEVLLTLAGAAAVVLTAAELLLAAGGLPLTAVVAVAGADEVVFRGV